MVFPVVMYGCESWTIKKAEHRRMDAFELWCWRRLLRVPWTTRRSNQSILKEIIPEYSMEGLVLKVKLQIFGRLMWRTDSLEKTLMGCWERLKSGRERDDRGWNGWMGSPTQWTWVWANSGKPGVLQSMGSQRVKHEWVSEQQMRWYLIVVLICISLRLVILSIFSYNCWSFVYLFWKNVNSSHLSNF